MTDAEVIDVLTGLGYDPDTIALASSGPDTKDVLVFPVLPDSDWYKQWTALRGVVAETGRWPVGTGEPFVQHDGREVLRFEFYGEGSESAAAALALAADFDADSIFDSYEPRQWTPDLTPMEYSLLSKVRDEELKVRWLAEANEELGIGPDLRDAELWLTKKRISEDREIMPHLDLWESVGDVPTWFALIPDDDPINGLAYVSTFSSHPVPALAVCRRWVEAHNVELVGAVSCGYMFEMPEPVADPDDAWRLGVEILGLWSCSAGGGPAGVDPGDIATALTKTERFDGTIYP